MRLIMKERYDELIKLIEKANYDYYTLDNPTVTDREYDNWMSELLDIEERHPEIKRKDSPSEKLECFLFLMFLMSLK